MTTTYDRAECAKLCREAREEGLRPDDAAIDKLRANLTQQCAGTPVSHLAHDAQAILWQLQQLASSNKDALRAMADQLEAAQARIDDLEGEARDLGCAVHVGAVHGGEAEELRAGIEQLIADDEELIWRAVRRELQDLLDRVDARDSLAHLERIDVAIAERDKLQAELDAAAARIARLESEHDTLCLVVEHTTGTVDKLTATRTELEAARREVTEMRPVVEAAVQWRSDDPPVGFYLQAAVDAYRAARGKAGG